MPSQCIEVENEAEYGSTNGSYPNCAQSIYRKLTKEILSGLDCKLIPLANFSADKLTYEVDIISK